MCCTVTFIISNSQSSESGACNFALFLRIWALWLLSYHLTKVSQCSKSYYSHCSEALTSKLSEKCFISKHYMSLFNLSIKFLFKFFSKTLRFSGLPLNFDYFVVIDHFVLSLFLKNLLLDVIAPPSSYQGSSSTFYFLGHPNFCNF